MCCVVWDWASVMEPFLILFLSLFCLIRKVTKESRKNEAINPLANPRPPFFHANTLLKGIIF